MSQTETSSTEYIAQSTQLVKEVVASSEYLGSSGYISAAAWNSLVRGGILAAALYDRKPENRRTENMGVIRAISREDPQLGLMHGIMSALVIDNIYKFASTDQRTEYFKKIRQGQLCGFAFTERRLSGSSLFMDSYFTDGYLTFSKRLQGISGHDLLVFALREGNPSILGLFLVEQKDIKTEIIKTEGLTGIVYACNSGHLKLNPEHILAFFNTRKDLALIQQIFTDSRLGFPGMSLGQLELLEKIATEYAQIRLIGPTLQKDMSVPKKELESITARRIIIQAIYEHSIDYLNQHPDTKRLAAEASMIKAFSTECALLAALTTAKLGGGDSFVTGGKLGYVNDLWPFTIFEGNNDMLYSQVGRSLAHSRLFDIERPGGLFDRAKAAQNLSPESKELINKLATHPKTQDKERVWGQIAARCLALGCLDKNRLDQREYFLATGLLNLEILQLGLTFFY